MRISKRRLSPVHLSKLLRLAIIGLAFTLLTIETRAEVHGRTRFGGSFGFGQASSTSADGKSAYGEGPIAFGATLDHVWSESWYVFAEHMRTYGEIGTAVGLTGFGVRYYPWLNPINSFLPSGAKADHSGVAVEGTSYYFASAVGLAQASVPAAGKVAATVAVGPYVVGKAGAEFRVTRDWYVNSEFNLGLTMGGAGSIQYFSLVFGGLYSL